MKKFILITAIIAVTVGTVTIFHACQKEENELSTNAPTTAILKSESLDNPFEQHGIWHNECLKYMFSQPDVANRTIDELWEQYGVEYFQNVLGDDYEYIPLDVLNDCYERTCNIVENKSYLEFLQELVEAGQINPENEFYFIERNNYNILYDYFTFLSDFSITSEESYWEAYNKLCMIEYEILVNYYTLLEGGVISPDDETDFVVAEYKMMLSCMAIARNSKLMWALPPVIQDGLILEDNIRLRTKIALIDMIAKLASKIRGYSDRGGTGFQIMNSAFASGGAAIGVPVIIDGTIYF